MSKNFKIINRKWSENGCWYSCALLVRPDGKAYRLSSYMVARIWKRKVWSDNVSRMSPITEVYCIDGEFYRKGEAFLSTALNPLTMTAGEYLMPVTWEQGKASTVLDHMFPTL